MRSVLYLGGLVAAAALLVWVDQSPSDVANQGSLLVLLAAAGSLGFACPGRAWLAGLVIGATLAAAHAGYIATGIHLPYAVEPAGWAGPATLLVLVVPATIAAYAGAGVARLIRRSHASGA